jgi:hypothetical protein
MLASAYTASVHTNVNNQQKLRTPEIIETAMWIASIVTGVSTEQFVVLCCNLNLGLTIEVTVLDTPVNNSRQRRKKIVTQKRPLSPWLVYLTTWKSIKQ